MRKSTLYILFAVSIAAVFCVWAQSRSAKATWANVPPPQSEFQAAGSMLGDTQMAYRANALMLINLGSTGGELHDFTDFNFDFLRGWLDLSDQLDERANIVPYLAAYYYSAVKDEERLRVIIDYLSDIGRKPIAGKWRWLAHATFLARHRLGDYELALKLARDLSALEGEGLPLWTKQMEAFVQYEQGEKEAAYDVLTQIMLRGGDDIPPEEVLVMREYICKKLLDSARAAEDPLCQF